MHEEKDLHLIISKLFGDSPKFKTGAIQVSEDEAIKRKLWPDKDDPDYKPFITDEQIESAWNEIKLELSGSGYIDDRKTAYDEAGLTFDYWNEINIEGDQVKIDKYISDRDQIRIDIPKPS